MSNLEHVTFITWNIHGSENGQNKPEQVANFLRTVPDVDVVLLQEICGVDDLNTQAHEIVSMLQWKTCVFGRAKATRTGVCGNAIISKLTTLEIFSPWVLPRGTMKKDDDSRIPVSDEPRCAIPVLLQTRSHRPFLAICTQLGHYNNMDQDRAVCQEPMKIILARIKADSFIEKHLPIILGGDFNVEWDDPTMSPGPIQPMIAGSGPRFNCSSSAPTYRVGTEEARKVDYILDRGRGVFNMEDHVVLESDISDHRPLLARWVLSLETE
jgi:endonuclease/exonuclease/phosphatase family metal-dependent hydrolase